jgi:hypothetical protein
MAIPELLDALAELFAWIFEMRVADEAEASWYRGREYLELDNGRRENPGVSREELAYHKRRMRQLAENATYEPPTCY